MEEGELSDSCSEVEHRVHASEGELSLGVSDVDHGNSAFANGLSIDGSKKRCDTPHSENDGVQRIALAAHGSDSEAAAYLAAVRTERDAMPYCAEAGACASTPVGYAAGGAPVPVLDRRWAERAASIIDSTYADSAAPVNGATDLYCARDSWELVKTIKTAATNAALKTSISLDDFNGAASSFCELAARGRPSFEVSAALRAAAQHLVAVECDRCHALAAYIALRFGQLDLLRADTSTLSNIEE